ncbi:MAG: substrate-binding domain-containing protein [Burkholderiales bacterium]|nr:substrate-binding domain-containing protein [Burkholderiales bacterium]
MHALVAPLTFLSAGAAQGLVQALRAEFEAAGGPHLQGRFGAVGAMKELLLAGQERCDVFVSTHRIVQELVADGHLRPASVAPLGRVHTGVAVRAGEHVPAIDTPEALRKALAAATAIYFPDPDRATAGIHFANVLAELGLAGSTSALWRTYPNGAAAMREMVAGGPPGAIGCTQVSEILITPGVQLVGALPQRFELATLYTAAVSMGARQPGAAARFIALLTSPAQHDVRERCGLTEP